MGEQLQLVTTGAVAATDSQDRVVLISSNDSWREYYWSAV